MSFIIAPDCVACDVQNGIAILNLGTNTYFGLDDVGACVWQALQKPASLSDLATAVARDFDVAQDACTPDIARLLDEMTQHGLVVRT